MIKDAAGVFLGQRLVLYRPDPEQTDGAFLLHAMRSDDVQAQIKAYGSGATVEHMRVPDCGELLIACPEAVEQRRIGAVLAAFDEIIEINERRIELSAGLIRSLYREWFVRLRFPGHDHIEFVDSELGAIPSNWAVVPTGTVLSPMGGGTPSRNVAEHWTGGTIPWFTPSDLTRSRVRYAETSADCITPLGLASSGARVFPADSVLMTSRATLGVLAIAARPATCNQGFIIIPPNATVPSEYVYEWLADKRDVLDAIATGATFKEITKGAFKRLPFLLPDAAVAAEFGAGTRPLSHRIRECERQNRQLAATRDLLLPRLVTGRLDVSDVDLGDLMPADAA